LPLHRQHPVALEVAEGSVVGDDLEAVADRLEPAPGAVAAVGALADQLGEQLFALVGGEHANRRADLLFGCGRRLEQERREQVVFGAAHLDQPHRRRRRRARPAAIEPEPSGPALGRLAALAQVLDPFAASVGPLDARQEARDHLVELGEDHRAVVARLGER
jgi:hypothetical protein